MASDKTSEVTVQQIYGKDVEYMHPEMLSSRLHPQHVSTLAGTSRRQVFNGSKGFCKGIFGVKNEFGMSGFS